MIEINLVPDIKQEFLRSQRLRAKVISGAILVSLAAGSLVVLLILFTGVQLTREKVADDNIKKQYSQLVDNNKDLADIVTIQQQLSNISTLNDDKQVSSRVFDVLTAVNPKEPNDVKMTQVNVDPIGGTIKIEGMAASGFNAVDALKKTILNTKINYTLNGESQTADLASSVEIGKTSLGEDEKGNRVLRFESSFKYPKELLSNKITGLRIVTPTETIDVTDSKLRVPDSLFAQPATDVKEGR